MARIIAIANQKGGVGKTTTAINLSACMAAAGKKVLLIDLDPQGNATSGLGIDKSTLNGTIYDAMVNGEFVRDLRQKTLMDNLHLIPANKELDRKSVV